MVDHAINEYRMIAICAYSLDTCGALEIVDVTSHHQLALIKRGSKWKVIESTKSRRAKTFSQESEARLRALVDNLPFEFWAMDSNFRYVMQNAISLKNYGNIVGKRIEDLEIGGEVKRKWMEQEMKALKGNILHEEYVRDVEGEKRVYENIIAPVIVDKAIISIVGVGMDMTDRKRVEEEIKQHNKELAALNRASQAISSSLDIRKVLDQIVEMAGSLVNADFTSIVLIEEDGSLGISAENFREGSPLGIRARPQGITRQIVASQQPLIFDNLSDDGTHNPDIAAAGVRSYAGLPVSAKGEVLGVLFVHSYTPGAFRDQLPLLTTFANQVAVAIENSRLFEAVSTGRERLQTLSRRLVEVQEVERRHIARELHDEIGQALTGLKLALEISTLSPAETVKTRLDEAKTLISELVAQVRDLSLDLRPGMLDDLGLLPALLWHFERYTAQTGVQVDFKCTGLEGQRFLPEVETAAYRIVQESLTNVARHAGVSQVTVRMWATQGRLNVQIEDQGSGFDPKEPLRSGRTSGLAGMYERAVLLGGQLKVESSPGFGTCVTAELPLGESLERRKKER